MGRKLIEVALPLDAINEQSVREKEPFTRNHPRSLHIWWARRPLATARAILFAQLVDDPSENEPEYRAEAERLGESDVDAFVEHRVTEAREDLFKLIREMANWDNVSNEANFDKYRDVILRATNGKPPAILDPFAGGGTIPIEAQRLGLEAHASDLNPVAVLINKALIEIPPKFADNSPVFPAANEGVEYWPRATGLAEDVRRYGQWMRDEAEQRIGHLYPKTTLADGSEATVIAWIWARTVKCPNPACGIEMPLVRSWWLGKKKGKEAYVVPSVVNGRVEYSIGHDPKKAPTISTDGTVGRNGAHCLSCDASVELSNVRAEASAGRMGSQLIAVVAEGVRSRHYIAPTSDQSNAADVSRPVALPVGDLPEKALGFRVKAYGMDGWADLFTNRQLTALTTFSDLVGEARERALRDALDAGMPEGDRLENGGTGAAAYADAIATFLGLAVSRFADMANSLCTWNPTNSNIRALFSRQAVPMAWDFAETNVLGPISLSGTINSAASSIAFWRGPQGFSTQADAASRSYDGLLISTDPPYYDNIGYSDLSDFFYVWLRRSLKDVHPTLLGTMLVPKVEELVANPYRHGGKEGAKEFFEDGFHHVFERARESANLDYPSAVYYAFKQSETESAGTASTGWETILGSMIGAGWSITATWPVRSERGARMVASGTNALASSIVLALRPRPEDAPIIDRRGFIAELRSSLPDALRALQQGSVAPVDLAQAAIGPGMAVFSKYSKVIEPGGSPMPVREALRQINAVLDEVVSEQEGDFDSDTRWCIAWFEARGFSDGVYGDAETLANAKNSSVEGLKRAGIAQSGAGKVSLIAPADLPEHYDPLTDDRISLWEVVLHLAKALTDKGLDEAGRILSKAEERGVDMSNASELAYLLYAIAEKKKMTQAGILFNTLGSSWADVREAAKTLQSAPPRTVAQTFDFDDEGE
ncbi:MAG: DUF1156 domain-containing protein [Microbacteriaceae bacterium]